MVVYELGHMLDPKMLILFIFLLISFTRASLRRVRFIAVRVKEVFLFLKNRPYE
jgi:hypothetical protein